MPFGGFLSQGSARHNMGYAKGEKVIPIGIINIKQSTLFSIKYYGFSLVC